MKILRFGPLLHLYNENKIRKNKQIIEILTIIKIFFYKEEFNCCTLQMKIQIVAKEM